MQLYTHTFFMHTHTSTNVRNIQCIDVRVRTYVYVCTEKDSPLEESHTTQLVNQMRKEGGDKWLSILNATLESRNTTAKVHVMYAFTYIHIHIHIHIHIRTCVCIGYITRCRSLRDIHNRGPKARGCVCVETVTECCN